MHTEWLALNHRSGHRSGFIPWCRFLRGFLLGSLSLAGCHSPCSMPVSPIWGLWFVLFPTLPHNHGSKKSVNFSVCSAFYLLLGPSGELEGELETGISQMPFCKNRPNFALKDIFTRENSGLTAFFFFSLSALFLAPFIAMKRQPLIGAWLPISNVAFLLLFQD